MAKILQSGERVQIVADYSAFHGLFGIVRRTFSMRDGYLDHAVSLLDNGGGKQVCFSRHELEQVR